ncbi:hypothetical protein BXY51_000416 [Actinoplanes cyaneus]|nr:hypothetical protein [Actinoplanes cyaneus]
MRHEYDREHQPAMREPRGEGEWQRGGEPGDGTNAGWSPGDPVAGGGREIGPGGGLCFRGWGSVVPSKGFRL